MRYTNKHGLPEAIAEAVRKDPYYAGGPAAEFTASGLPQPARIRALFREHADEIEEDVSDSIYRLLGQSIHVILERAGRTEVREKRLFAEVAGVKVSAQLDTFTVVGGKITEWKLSSVWTAVYGGREDWVEQMNVQAEVLARNGVEPRELEVGLIFRDWQKSKGEAAAAKNEAAGEVRDGYPTVPVVLYSVPLWNQDRRVAYIVGRARVHREAALGLLPDCTAEERWERKPGQPTRCLSWCNVARWCDQHQAFLAERKRRA